MVFPNEVVALPDPAVASDLVDGPTFQDKLVAQVGPYKPVVEALQAHGLTLPTRTLAKTGAYTMVPGDGTVLADATGGAFAVTLPPHLNGRLVRVEKVDASGNAVTVLPGLGTVGGAANDPLEARWHGATYQSDGTNWTVVARAVPRGTYAQTQSGVAATAVDTSATGQTKAGKLTLTTTPEIKVDTLSSVAPEVHLRALNSRWGMGIDVANNGGARDFVPVFRINANDTVDDVVYVANNAPNYPTIGFGVTPPTELARVQITGQDSQPDMGCLRLRVGPTQTGNPFAVHTSAPADIFTIDPIGTLSGANTTFGSAIAIKANATNDRPLSLVKADGSVAYDFQFLANGILFRNTNGAVNIFQATTGGSTFWYGAMQALAGVLVTGDAECVTASAGVILKSPNGTRYRLTVDNAGSLFTAAA